MFSSNHPPTSHLVRFHRTHSPTLEREVRGHPFMTSTWRGSGSGGRLWTGGPATCGRPHRKLKLESTDVILSSSQQRSWRLFKPEFRLWTEKSGFCNIN